MHKTASQTNSVLFELSDQKILEQEKAYQVCVYELKKFILPSIEDQLLIRKFFCSAQKDRRKKVSKNGYSLADVVIYHELYTALAYTQVLIDQNSLPHTAEWVQTLTQENAIISQNNKLQEFLSQTRNDYL